MSERKARGIRWLFRSRAEIETDVDEEISFHLDMRTAALVREGLDRSAAEQRALSEFGDVASLRASLRDSDTAVQRRTRASVWWDDLRQDVRLSLRALRRAPAFSTIALATLAVGIGAAVATFTVVNAVMLRPLPYPEPDRLVRLSPGQNANITMAERMEEGAPSLEYVSGISQWNLVLTGAGAATQLGAQVVEPEFFDVVGVRPALGRAFREDERDIATADVVVLSHELWQSRFGGDRDVVGRRIRLDGYDQTSREVIGVMPADFVAPPVDGTAYGVDMWIPLRSMPGRTVASDSSWYVNNVIARMRDGATVSGVAQEVQRTMERIRSETSRISDDAVRRAGAAGLLDSLIGDLRQVMWTLLGAVGLVLLLACANLGNLLLARGERRRQELAARAALGGTRARLVRELVTESTVLAAVGGAAGTLLAYVVLQILRVSDVSGLPRATDLSMDGRVLMFALAVTAGCVVLFGVLPALRATSGDLRPSLGPGTRVQGQSRYGRRFGAVLIAAEVALAMILVTGAALLLTSFRSLRSVPPGMDTSDVLAVEVSPASAEYPDARAVALYDVLFERIRNLPRVKAVGAIHLLPLTGGNWSFPYLAQGHEPPANAPLPSANYRVVTPDYFDALDIPVIAGRAFESDDVADGEQVGIINEALAEQLWPGEDAVGREILLFGNMPFRVVGVVGDVRQHSLAMQPLPEMYRPLTQWTLSGLTVMVETDSDPASLATNVRDIVRDIDAEIPVVEARPLEAVLEGSLARRRFFLGVLTCFGLVALVLGGIGIYGVMSYAAAARVPEFGVRIAMGATSGEVLRLSFLAALAPVAAGLAAGTLGAVSATRLLDRMLYEVQPNDASTLVIAALTLGTVAVLASWIPARRASRVDPMRVLGSA